MSIILFGLFEFLLNIPFGAWRSGTKKFSFAWLLAIHTPVPIIVIGRMISGMHYEWKTLPFYLLCYGLGQYFGGKTGNYLRDRKGLTKVD